MGDHGTNRPPADKRGGSRQPRRSPTPRSRTPERKSAPRDRQDRPTRERPAGSRTRVGTSVQAPPLPDDVTGEELDRSARRELRTLPKGLADQVARHLVQAGRVLQEDPESAYLHARAALHLASRVPAVREAAGITAYRTGRWAEALAELRAVRRMSGGDEFLPMMADCERGLGRPERALALAGSPEAQRLDQASLVEMRIVAAGARCDLGQADAAVVTLQLPQLKRPVDEPWWPRLAYAYADALLAAGRTDDATTWFQAAAERDFDEATDAVERLAELTADRGSGDA
jgi:predicted Zn-dependent protease